MSIFRYLTKALFIASLLSVEAGHAESSKYEQLNKICNLSPALNQVLNIAESTGNTVLAQAITKFKSGIEQPIIANIQAAYLVMPDENQREILYQAYELILDCDLRLIDADFAKRLDR